MTDYDPEQLLPMVYVAGPITKPDPLTNTHRGLRVATMMLDCGVAIPFSPHLTAFWEIVAPRPYEDWMGYDFQVIRRCDALYRIEGESAGADREIALAESLPIPVFREDEDDWSRMLVWAQRWTFDRWIGDGKPRASGDSFTIVR